MEAKLEWHLNRVTPDNIDTFLKYLDGADRAVAILLNESQIAKLPNDNSHRVELLLLQAQFVCYRGIVQRKCGNYPEAAKHGKVAEQIIAPILPQSHEEVLITAGTVRLAYVNTLFMREDFAEAESILKKISVEGMTREMKLVYLSSQAHLLYIKNEHLQAIQSVDEAIRIVDESHAVLYFDLQNKRARSLIQLKRYEEAEEALTTAKNLAGSDPALQSTYEHTIGRMHLLRGNTKKAQAAFRESLRYSEAAKEPLVSRARIQNQIGVTLDIQTEAVEAEKVFRSCVEAAPGNLIYKNNLAVAQFIQKRDKEAANTLGDALSQHFSKTAENLLPLSDYQRIRMFTRAWGIVETYLSFTQSEMQAAERYRYVSPFKSLATLVAPHNELNVSDQLVSRIPSDIAFVDFYTYYQLDKEGSPPRAFREGRVIAFFITPAGIQEVKLVDRDGRTPLTTKKLNEFIAHWSNTIGKVASGRRASVNDIKTAGEPLYNLVWSPVAKKIIETLGQQPKLLLISPAGSLNNVIFDALAAGPDQPFVLEQSWNVLNVLGARDALQMIDVVTGRLPVPTKLSGCLVVGGITDDVKAETGQAALHAFRTYQAYVPNADKEHPLLGNHAKQTRIKQRLSHRPSHIFFMGHGRTVYSPLFEVEEGAGVSVLGAKRTRLPVEIDPTLVAHFEAVDGVITGADFPEQWDGACVWLLWCGSSVGIVAADGTSLSGLRAARRSGAWLVFGSVRPILATDGKQLSDSFHDEGRNAVLTPFATFQKIRRNLANGSKSDPDAHPAIWGLVTVSGLITPDDYKALGNSQQLPSTSQITSEPDSTVSYVFAIPVVCTAALAGVVLIWRCKHRRRFVS